MKEQPLVTVICLCYNHSKYVEEALNSVINQSYTNVQLIIVNDASTDNSIEVISQFCDKHTGVEFIDNQINLGNCKSFNQALNYAKGEYLIDLAADDVLEPDRIQEGVKAFETYSNDFGVNFCNAEYINASGEHLKYFYSLNNPSEIEQGDMFSTLLERYAICSPTTMFKREVIEQMGGYDESLSYEDFDFWIRSSRHWKYCYTNKVLVKKRELADSLGSRQYTRKSNQRHSTYKVCLKAFDLCRTSQEFRALGRRIRYEQKHSLWNVNVALSIHYLLLWIKVIRQ